MGLVSMVSQTGTRDWMELGTSIVILTILHFLHQSDMNKLTNGCEIDLTTNPDHCGNCSFVCSNHNMATRTCSMEICNGMCSTGFADWYTLARSLARSLSRALSLSTLGDREFSSWICWW